jgi:hypothetical protein
MNGKISLPGLFFGALTAVVAVLLVSRYSFGWMVLGVALGMLMVSAFGRREGVRVTLPKGRQQ